LASSPEFVPAIALNEGFYRDVVAPLVAPWQHSAAHLGWGSDVLGYDTERSTDHGWGPRLCVFVAGADAGAVRDVVNRGLPDEYRGWPVRFGWDDVPERHHVYVGPLAAWAAYTLGCDATGELSHADWLTMPQQKLLGVVRGCVYHDGAGTLTQLRARLAHFPPEIRLWMLASQWQRIQQVEHFTGRTAEVGDELGSRLLAAEIVRDLMRLHFLLANVYWPYVKWFGTAYASLPGNELLRSFFNAAVDARDYPAREAALCAAYEALARMHNASGLTEPVDPTVRPFHGRPFRVLMAERIANACRHAITDDRLRALPLVGSIDQCVDSTDVVQYPEVAQRLRALYDEA
jgi:hypothetical protein